MNNHGYKSRAEMEKAFDAWWKENYERLMNWTEENWEESIYIQVGPDDEEGYDAQNDATVKHNAIGVLYVLGIKETEKLLKDWEEMLEEE